MRTIIFFKIKKIDVIRWVSWGGKAFSKRSPSPTSPEHFKSYSPLPTENIHMEMCHVHVCAASPARHHRLSSRAQHEPAHAQYGLQDIEPARVYLSWPIEPGRLPAFVDAARLLNIRGCSITIPHKIDIIPLLDKTSENVREMGACNTLYRDGEKICGENTDVIGFTAPLRKRSLPPETRVLVLGAGGVSRAAIADCGGSASPYYPHQPPERARGSPLQRIRFAVRSVEERGDVPADLIINTDTTRHDRSQEHETPYPWAFQDNGIAYDLIYTPFQTRFLRDAAAAGGKPSQASTCSSAGTRNSTCGRGTIFGRSHNGGDFRALWTIKKRHTLHFPINRLISKNTAKRLNFPPYCFPKNCCPAGTHAGQPPHQSRVFGMEGGGLEGEGLSSESPSPPIFHSSNARITCSGVMDCIHAWLRSQCFLPCSVQGRQSSCDSRTRSFGPAGKKPILPSWAQTAPKRACRPPPRDASGRNLP